MGVYVFVAAASKQPGGMKNTCIKVGHYRKDNPWSRVAHRGFRSCRGPPGSRSLTVEDLELIAWYPQLTLTDEKATHQAFLDVAVCGEWYPWDAKDAILGFLDARGDRREVTNKELEAACATRRRL